MNSFYFDKMHMLYNQNKSCVKSCKKTLLFLKTTTLFSKKNPLLSPKTHCFPTCALFYPIVLKRKIITDCICTTTSCKQISTWPCMLSQLYRDTQWTDPQLSIMIIYNSTCSILIQ